MKVVITLLNILIFLTMCPSCWAISGTVSDQFGYGVSNLTVTFTNQSNQWTYTTQTNSSGYYEFPSGVQSPADLGACIPSELILNQNFPNPFNPSTTISFILKKSGDVNLSIYNVNGQKVKTLIAETVQAGEHRIMWDGTSDQGGGVSAGVYICALWDKTSLSSRKLVLLDGNHVATNGWNPTITSINESGNNVIRSRTIDELDQMYDVSIIGPYIHNYNTTIDLQNWSDTCNFQIYNKLISHHIASNFNLIASESPYYLQGSVNIEENVNVTIEPNVDLLCFSNSQLIIKETVDL